MSPSAAKPADLVEKRKPLTRAETLFLCIAQQGRCGCGCGFKLDPITEGVIDEHIIALELTGPNALTNRSLYRKPCAKRKTAEQDAPAIAKAKRLAGETCTGPKRPIPSRKFDKPAVPQKIAQRADPWPKRSFPSRSKVGA
jgi:5-methylcytosine-specific restriction protein A